MQWRFARLQQCHTLFGTRDQQRGKVEICNHFHAALNQFIFAFALTDHRFKFRQIRRQQRCATIAFKIGPFRIDKHRHPSLTRQSNHLLHACQRAFGVIGEHQSANGAQSLVNTLMQWLRIHAFKTFFEIQANQLLVAGKHAQFGDRRMSWHRNEVTFYVHIRQRFAQRTRRVVNPSQANQTRIRSQRGNVHRHVCCATGTFFNGINLHHRNRRFR